MAIFLTDITSLRAQRHLRNTTLLMNSAMLRLSSGLRINSAKDDPAGLMISDRLSSEINGLYQASRNTSDGIALAQTMEGAMDEITNMLQRLRTLAVQSANGTLTSSDREAIQKEVNSLSAEISRIADQTTFGGSTILLGKDGANTLFPDGSLSIQVGAYADNVIVQNMDQDFRLSALDKAANGDDSTLLNADGHIDMSTQDKASAAISGIDSLIKLVNSERADLGALQVRLDSAMRIQSNTRVNLSDARSRIRDTDFAEESANLFRQSILQQSALSMLMQSRSLSNNMILRLLGAV